MSRISNGLEEPWPATVDTVFGTDHSVINAPHEDVIIYLKNIDMLWRLGKKPYQPGPTSR